MLFVPVLANIELRRAASHRQTLRPASSAQLLQRNAAAACTWRRRRTIQCAPEGCFGVVPRGITALALYARSFACAVHHATRPHCRLGSGFQPAPPTKPPRFCVTVSPQKLQTYDAKGGPMVNFMAPKLDGALRTLKGYGVDVPLTRDQYPFLLLGVAVTEVCLVLSARAAYEWTSYKGWRFQAAHKATAQHAEGASTCTFQRVCRARSRRDAAMSQCS